jgi:hypothetical protein
MTTAVSVSGSTAPIDGRRGCLRHQLRELSATVRVLERAWLLGLSTGPSPLDDLVTYRDQLLSAQAKLVPYGEDDGAVPQFWAGSDAFPNPWVAGNAVEAKDHNPDPGLQTNDARFYSGERFTGDDPIKQKILTYGGVPYLSSNSFLWGKVDPMNFHTSSRGWFFNHFRPANETLRDYILSLHQGYDGIKDARNAMGAAAGWLNNVVAAPPTDAKRLQVLGELIANALAALSTLLDQMSEIVTAPPDLPNGMRLGMQVLYRQHWIPTGYVKGKLVGYKTLLPSESMTLKRRTFIKTTRETTTSSSFAASRQNDFSQTQRETSEMLNEASSKFGFDVSASGHVDFGIGGAELKTGANGNLGNLLKGTRSSLSEMVTKGSVSYNNKREVKIRELVETENAEESLSEVKNANQEITANYFYYQLLREYETIVELHDIRPVLMITREYPSAASIDEKFICRYVHVLLTVLPPQLADDAEQSCEDIVAAGRQMLRAQKAASYAWAEFQVLRDGLPASLEDQDRQRLADARDAANKARQEYFEAEATYQRLSSRVDRIVSFVRENLLMCMQRIWQSTSTVDREAELRQLTYNGTKLDEITQGLHRVGFLGAEELYEYTGNDLTLLADMLWFLNKDSDVLQSTVLKNSLINRIMLEQGVDQAAAEAQLASYIFIHDDDIYDIVNGTSTVASAAIQPQADRVQIAQDALVVEAMPGNIPLLEGFKLAHRALDVEKACLENEHLRQRIAAKVWEKGGERYDVLRVEGASPESSVAAAEVIKP